VLEHVAAAHGRSEAVEWAGVGTLEPELVDTMPALRRLAQLREDPDLHSWLLRVLVVDDATAATGVRIVGHLGGHGPPEEDGAVEVGYTIAAAERRQGLASEAARTWFTWAHERGAQLARLSTTPDNVASQGVARRLGLIEVGATWDEDDACWELVFEGALPLAERGGPR
jgi:RimJ/RimL family protein N-acetyltransferase